MNDNTNTPQKITGFRHAKYRDSIIYADDCIVYQNCGIALYKDNKCIWFKESKILEVQLVGNTHYYIKMKENDNSFGECMYLILQEREEEFPKEELKVGDKVIRNDYHTYEKHKLADVGILFFLYHDNQEIFEKNENQINAEFTWEIKEIIDNNIVLLSRENDSKKSYSLLKNVETIEHLKKCVIDFKNNKDKE